MKPQEQAWLENKTIGEMAERAVKFLIDSMPGWKCIPYGMENHISELKQILKNNHKNGMSRKIRSMPDFIAVNSESKEVYLIDVKFRSINGKPNGTYGFSYNQIKDYLEFWNPSYLFIVQNTEPYFSIVSIADIKEDLLKSTFRLKGNVIERWDFSTIIKPVNSLFPHVNKDSFEKAVSWLPKKS